MSVEVRDAVAAEQPQSLAERRVWFTEQQRRGFPVLVAVESGSVVGMTSYGDFRDSIHRPGYRFTAEHSIHVRGDRRGGGVGRLLLDALIDLVPMQRILEPIPR